MSADRILSQLLGSGAAGGFAGGLAGSLAGNLLTSKSGRKLGKRALQVGGIAAVGGLAYAAWQRHRDRGGPPAAASPSASTSPSLERFVPAAAAARESEALGLTLLRAMIAAAQADGRLDAAERKALHTHVRGLDLSDGEKLDLLAALDQPVDLNDLVRAAHTPEIAAEIYTASLLAIDLDTPEERAYMSLLAVRLGLPEGLVASIHEELEPSATAPVLPEPARAAS